jgi:hypothetical protein
MKTQNPQNVSLETIIDYFKKNFATEKNWEKLMREYWDKVKLFFNVNWILVLSFPKKVTRRQIEKAYLSKLPP